VLDADHTLLENARDTRSSESSAAHLLHERDVKWRLLAMVGVDVMCDASNLPECHRRCSGAVLPRVVAQTQIEAFMLSGCMY